MDAITHATETATGGEVRRRPYLGRYVPPPPPQPPRKLTVAERIEMLRETIGMARNNAHIAMREGDNVKASAAFYRAHEYVEMLREMRSRL